MKTLPAPRIQCSKHEHLFNQLNSLIESECTKDVMIMCDFRSAENSGSSPSWCANWCELMAVAQNKGLGTLLWDSVRLLLHTYMNTRISLSLSLSLSLSVSLSLTHTHTATLTHTRLHLHISKPHGHLLHASFESKSFTRSPE